MLKIGGQRIPRKALLVVISDCLLITLGLWLASALRFWGFETVLQDLQDPLTLSRFALVILVCEVSFYYHDLYNFQVTRRSWQFIQLLQALGVACLVLALLYYLDPRLSLGRGVAMLAAPTVVTLTLGWRLILDTTGFFTAGSERVLIVGTGLAGIHLTREIVSRPELNLKVLGFLDEKGDNVGKSLVNPGIIGGISDLAAIVEKEKIDRVVLSMLERRGRTPIRELLQLKFAGVAVEDAHHVHERIAGTISLAHLSPSWLILSEGFRKSLFLLAAKRTLDVVVSFCALVLALPFMGLIALAIWMETGRPILFSQERTGLGERPFLVLKFRSMYQNAEENGPQWAVRDDCRITRAGSFLRRFRLDELPQLFNVFRGEMSLVGPRPERPSFCQMLAQEIPFFSLRNSVRPGITGWAQIKYQYGSSIEEAKTKLEYDLFYIKHMSFFLDLAILFETAKVVLYGRGAK